MNTRKNHALTTPQCFFLFYFCFHTGVPVSLHILEHSFVHFLTLEVDKITVLQIKVDNFFKPKHIDATIFIFYINECMYGEKDSNV